MKRSEILELLRRNPAFHLATLEDGEPRVRGMLLFSADEEGIVFHSGAGKDVHRQIVADPRVEMCFNDMAAGVQVRVRGTLEVVADPALKQRIVEHPSRAFLGPWLETSGPEAFFAMLQVYRLRGARATVWTIEANFAPKEWMEV